MKSYMGLAALAHSMDIKMEWMYHPTSHGKDIYDALLQQVLLFILSFFFRRF